MKTLNTQLASWTQLRHDTILYTKPSFTDSGICVYPTGYVEPRIEFWNRLATLAEQAGQLMQSLSTEGTYGVLTNVLPHWDPTTGQLDLGGPMTNQIAQSLVRGRQVAHLHNFATITRRLQRLAEKELAQECFNPEDLRFVDGLMEDLTFSWIHCTPVPTFNGWYPTLFYRAITSADDAQFRKDYGCEASDFLVADVHTDVSALGDVGSVLHEAVGSVNLLMMAVDNGGDRFICAGPVLSHYEFEITGSPRRLSDQEWQQILGDRYTAPVFPKDAPARRFEGLKPPLWTKSYLVSP